MNGARARHCETLHQGRPSGRRLALQPVRCAAVAAREDRACPQQTPRGRPASNSYISCSGVSSRPSTLVDFANIETLDIIGIFPNYAEAHKAWKAAAQRSVDTPTCAISSSTCTACWTPKRPSPSPRDRESCVLARQSSAATQAGRGSLAAANLIGRRHTIEAGSSRAARMARSRRRSRRAAAPGWKAGTRHAAPLPQRLGVSALAPDRRCPLLTSGVAATTGGYPLIIKHSFDALLKGDQRPALGAGRHRRHHCAAAVDVPEQLMTARIVARMTTDLQEAAFAHLINSDYARLTREPRGLVSRLTNDLSFIQQSAQTSLFSFVRDVLSVIALIGAMFYIDWMLALIVVAIYPFAILPMGSIGKRLRRVAPHPDPTRRYDLAAHRDSLRRAPDQGIPPRELRDRAPQPQLRGPFDLRMKSVRARGRLRPRSRPWPDRRGRHRRLCLLANHQWRQHGRRFHGLRRRAAVGSPADRSLGTVATSTLEGLAAADRIYELLDEKPTIVDRPGARRSPSPVRHHRVRQGRLPYDTAAGLMAVTDFSLAVPGGKTVALVGAPVPASRPSSIWWRGCST